MTPHYLIEQQVTYQNGAYTTEYGDVRKSGFTAGNEYPSFFLEEEVKDGGSFSISTITIPEVKDAHELSDAELKDVLADLWVAIRSVQPTLMYITKDSSFVAVTIKDKNDVPRDWMDLHTLLVDMEGKIMKRLAMLGTRSYLNGLFEIALVEDDGTYHKHVPGKLTMIIRSTSEEEEPYVDGSFHARKELREELISMVPDLDDEDRLVYLIQSFMNTRCFNARIPTPWGTLKGDVEFADELPADIVVYDCNIVKAVKSLDGFARVQLTPQEQLGSVRTNRQSLAHFEELLFSVRTPVYGPSMGLVKDAMVAFVNKELQLFESGEPLSFVEPAARQEDDAIRSVQTKIMKWKESGRSLNDSLYLLMAMAAQRRDMWLPKPGDSDSKREKKTTRFPVPCSFRVSLRNETSYEATYGVKPNLRPGECFIDPELGLIVSNHDWKEVIESLGGADKDDHVEVHFRIAKESGSFRGIQFAKGEMVMFLIRSPIGTVSDGKKLASEYYILKPNAAFANTIMDHFGALPEIDLSLRPVHILDMVSLGQGKTPTKPSLPTSFTPKFFLDQLYGAVRSRMVYDIHSALMRKCQLLNQPFKFYAREEYFIDSCAQWRNPVDLLWINKNNMQVEKLLPKKGDMPITVLDEYSAFYLTQVQRFIKGAQKHILAQMERLNEKYADDPIRGLMHDDEPILLHWIHLYEAKYIEMNAVQGELTSLQVDAVGDMVVRGMDLMVSDTGKWAHITQEHADLALVDAYVYYMQKAKKSRHQSAGLHNMVAFSEAPVMAGKLFDRLIEVL